MCLESWIYDMVIWLAWLLVATIIMAILIESKRECSKFSVETQIIRSSKISKPYRFVFLSDLHECVFGNDNDILVEAIRDSHPDSILIGGDMVNVQNKGVEKRVTEDLIGNLVELGPVYYANGNNELRFLWDGERIAAEYQEFLNVLKKHNVHYLDNESAVFGDVRITGLNIEYEHYREFVCKKLTTDYIQSAVGESDPGRYNILLIHSPLFPEVYWDWGADLALSGHSHGGLFRFPTDRRKEPGRLNNDRGLISGQYQLFHKYCSGYFENADGQVMVVSRGLGTHGVNIRVNNIPQLIVVDLKPEV